MIMIAGLGRFNTKTIIVKICYKSNDITVTLVSPLIQILKTYVHKTLNIKITAPIPFYYVFVIVSLFFTLMKQVQNQ